MKLLLIFLLLFPTLLMAQTQATPVKKNIYVDEDKDDIEVLDYKVNAVEDKLKERKASNIYDEDKTLFQPVKDESQKKEGPK